LYHGADGRGDGRPCEEAHGLLGIQTQTKQATENDEDDDEDETFPRPEDPEAKLFGKTGSTSWWCF